MRDDLEHTIEYACFAAARGAMRRDQADGENIRTLRTRLASLRQNHARLWRSRSREGGLSHSDSFFGQVDQTLADARGGSAQHGVTMFE